MEETGGSERMETQTVMVTAPAGLCLVPPDLSLLPTFGGTCFSLQGWTNGFILDGETRTLGGTGVSVSQGVTVLLSGG
jgi:hypothetical protein